MLKLKWNILICLIIGMAFNTWAVDSDSQSENLEIGAVSATGTKYELNKFLVSMTVGNNGFYNKVLSPAKSLKINLSDSDRIQEVNSKIIHEIHTVINEFTIATEEKKLETMRAVIFKFDPELAKNNGSNITFMGNSPSAAFSRVAVLIKKTSAIASAESLLKSFSSYKRSAIPSTFIYEYSDAANISQSTIKAVKGTDLSWKLPHAALSIRPGQDLVLKKCRQIFGWKCVTSLYRTGQLQSGKESIKYFYASMYDLATNPDHPEFADDKRSINQITGSTALYVVKESAGWLMLYGIDSQWNQGSITFKQLISDELSKDLKRVKERLALDLKVSPLDIY